MELNIDEMAAQALEEMMASGKIQEMVGKQLESMLKGAIQEAMGYGSAFSNALKSYVEKQMPLDFSAMDLGSYNASVLSLVKQKVEACRAAWVDKGIAGHLEEILRTPKAEMQVSELVGELRKWESGYALKITVEDRDTAGYWALKIKKGDYAEYRLAVTGDGEVYSITLPYEGDVTKRVMVSKSAVAGILWGLYVGKTKLIRDMGDRDYEAYDEEDG